MANLRFLFQALLLLGLAAYSKATGGCDPNNCLRAFLNPNQLAGAQTFCNTFLQNSKTALDAIPTYAVNACPGDVASLVSSACSCVVTQTIPTYHPPTATPSPSTPTSVPSTTSSSAATQVSLDCQPDNCLRQFSQSPAVTTFCATYTQVVNTATANLPPYVSQCSGKPSRVSSACSCIVTPSSAVPTSSTRSISSTSSTSSKSPTSSTPPISPSSSTSKSQPTTASLDCQPDNCLRQFSQSPIVTAFCATYTQVVNTATDNLPPYVSQCSGKPSRVSSACSCIVTSPRASPTPTSSWTTKTTSTSTTRSTSSPSSKPPTTSPGSPTPTPLDCQPDNCLRQFSQSPAVTAFCATYTTALNTASTALPPYVSQCAGIPSRVSSACSCIVAPSFTPPRTNIASTSTAVAPCSITHTATATVLETATVTTLRFTTVSVTATTTQMVLNCAACPCYY